MKNLLTYFCDDHRHLVCVSYSIENLHEMAADLGIKKCWFHRDHYDVPKRRIDEIKAKCELVSSRQIWRIIHGSLNNEWENGKKRMVLQSRKTT